MQKRVFTELQATTPLGRRHHVQVDDNMISFCLPETFSPDFSAPDIAARISTRKVHNENTQQEGHIARGWWDLKEPDRPGQPLGTLMLNIELRALPNNQDQALYPGPHDMLNRFHFLLALYERLCLEYRPSVREDHKNGFTTPMLAFTIGDRWATGFSDCFYNNQAWTSFQITQNQNVIDGYAIPVTKRCYLSLTLTYAPNPGVHGHFLHLIGMPLAQAFLDSLKIGYGATNPIKPLVEVAWHNTSAEKAIIENKHRLIAPLLNIHA